MSHKIAEIFGWIVRIVAEPNDDEEIKLRKSLLVVSTYLFILSGIIWSLIYIYLGNLLAGSIPLAYTAISLINLIYFRIKRHYYFFHFIQLMLFLLLPFLMMLVLGGFITGSAVILWSIISPLGAMLFDDPKYALHWFLAFLSLIILSAFLQKYINFNSYLPNDIIILFFVINFIGVSTIIFLLIFYFVTQKNRFQEQSESLLLNILPKEIAAILKNNPRVIAEHFDEASVLFADVVNFTPMSATMTPIELVELLNEVFSYFDLLVEKYGLEKIKTIGDCYMVASGIPRPNKYHAQALVYMALEMHKYVNENKFNGHKLSLRIGINSGPVVAGVIGYKKFIYDLWGDAVNTASRMESHGQGGIIQITRSTYELIKDDFICEPRGTVNVKGKGAMEVWFVTGVKKKKVAHKIKQQASSYT